MNIRLVLFAAAVFGALSLVPTPLQAEFDSPPAPQLVAVEEDPREYFFSPREDEQKFVYNMPFYPPGKAPSGELEYDPTPFEDLLPRFDGEEEPQPIAVPMCAPE